LVLGHVVGRGACVGYRGGYRFRELEEVISLWGENEHSNPYLTGKGMCLPLEISSVSLGHDFPLKNRSHTKMDGTRKAGYISTFSLKKPYRVLEFGSVFELGVYNSQHLTFSYKTASLRAPYCSAWPDLFSNRYG
jgi:hypothetical protein